MASDDSAVTAPDEAADEAADPMLDVSGLTKIYPDGTLAVDGIDFSVDPGDFCVVIGPSGCGKSTTLHSLVGNIEVTAGRIAIDGDDVTDEPTFERDIGLVFQDFQLFPHLTVRENIEYGLERMDVDEEERQERVERLLDMMQLGELADRHPEELSAGQKQRVALARSLVLEPKLLLLDEPLGDMDYKLQKRMERELLRIHREFETTFVYVTHDQTQAMRLADQIIVVNDGKVEQSGSVGEVYNSPETAFVSAFVGDSNTFTGEVTHVDDETGNAVVETTVGTFQAGTDNLDARPQSLVGEEIPFSVRPQHLTLSDDHINTLDCRVDDVLDQPGSSTQVLLRTDSADETKEVLLKSWTLDGTVADTVTVGWDPERTTLLERVSVVDGIDLQTDVLGS
jgi:ABC-type Fe3+/spermidine/putrescine transport system ATPase subunit